MEFKKNKSKVICFYIGAFIVISFILWAALDLFVKDKNVILFFVLGEIALIASVIMNAKALVGELNQTVILNEEKVECKSFFVAGNLANATFEYNQIKTIQMKRTLFSRCLIIKVKDSENIPVVLNNQFENHMKLWRTICDGCKSQNPNINMDSKIYDYLNKHS